MEDQVSPEQQQRLEALQERMERFKKRDMLAKDRAELHAGFQEITSILEELYDLAGDSVKGRAADVLAIMRFLKKATSGNPAEAAEASNDLLRIKSFKHFVAKRLFTDIPSRLGEAAIQELKSQFEGLPEADRRQTLYLQKLALTDDAFGIVVRGHVLIENALQACIYAYVPNPVDVYRKLELFFSQKIRLAYMLGVVSVEEQLILDRFNGLRNKLAHYGRGTHSKAPDFHLTAEHERALWVEFTKVTSMGGDWAPYDPSIFPTHLRYIVMHLYFTLGGRAKELRKRKLAPIVSELLHEEDSVMLSYITKLSIDLFNALGGREQTEGQGA